MAAGKAKGEMGLAEGLIVRAPAMGDLEAVAELVRACETADDGEPEATSDDIRGEWQLPGFRLADDAWIATTLEGGIVGYASVWERAAARRFEADGYTHPEYRGRGIGTRLITLTEARAQERMTATAAEHIAVLLNRVSHANREACHLLENEGYSAARYYWRMEIEVESPPAAVWPEGVRARSFRPGADERAVHSLVQDAFADNFDYSPMPFEGWAALMVERESFDPELFVVAQADTEIVGAALSPRYENTGWIRQLAVRREWRGRGIALALLQHVFREFWRRGQRRVGLVVDSYNRTGAKGLYERAGMRVVRQHDGYRKVFKRT